MHAWSRLIDRPHNIICGQQRSDTIHSNSNSISQAGWLVSITLLLRNASIICADLRL